MVSRSKFAPLVTKLERPVVVAADLCFALPTAIDAAEAKRLLTAECKKGLSRPADLETSGYFEEPTLVHLPVWRSNIHAEGFHIGVSTVSIPSSRNRHVPLPIPTGGTDNRDVVVVSSARRFFAYDVAPALIVPQDKLVPLAHAEVKGLVAEPDVPQAQAEQESTQRVRAALRPANAIYARAEATVRATALVYVPLWVMRYRYDGEAVPGVAEEFHAVLDGAFGRVVSAKHPSGFRSVVGKMKRLFSAG
jgi:hypothetical protein